MSSQCAVARPRIVYRCYHELERVHRCGHSFYFPVRREQNTQCYSVVSCRVVLQYQRNMLLLRGLQQVALFVNRGGALRAAAEPKYRNEGPAQTDLLLSSSLYRTCVCSNKPVIKCFQIQKQKQQQSSVPSSNTF